MKKIIAILIFLTILLPYSFAFASDDEGGIYTTGDFIYTLLGDGTAEITEYGGDNTNLVIPDCLESHPVVSIGERAFALCNKLNSVTIPNSITSIAKEAFYGCTSLNEITIPDSVISIGDGAFSLCFNLTSVTIPNSVTHISSNPFSYCSSLETIRISPDHPVLAVIDGVLFSKPEAKLICYPAARAASHYEIPQGTDNIGIDAFYGCLRLTTVTIPNSVTSIADEAFTLCLNLTSVNIPNSVTSIGNSVFYACEKIKTIAIPDSVTFIGSNPFTDCSSLETIRVSPDHPVLAVIDGVLFNKPDKKLLCYPAARSASLYEIPQGITSIGDLAFAFCDNLTSITIPDSVTSIADGAFAFCDNLTSISIPDSVTTIGEEIFSYSDSLTEIIVGRYSYARKYCIEHNLPYTDEPGIITSDDFTYILLDDGNAEITEYTGDTTSILIPDYLDGHPVTSIGKRAFAFCNSLTEITIPNSITRINNNPFESCSSLETISVSPDHPVLAVIDGVLFSKTDKKLVCYPAARKASHYEIPQGIAIIDDYSFYECNNLTTVTIPDSVTIISGYAFYGCSNLTIVTIPDSVKHIGSNPFAGCSSLETISVSPDHPVLTIIDGALFNKSVKKLVCFPAACKASHYDIPQGFAIIGSMAFYDCDNLTDITIPDSVTAIFNDAFSFCDKLTEITIPNSVTSIEDWAFYGCSNLTTVTIPDSVTSIGNNAFSYCKKLTSIIVGHESFAREYCIANDLPYNYTDANDWLNN